MKQLSKEDMRGVGLVTGFFLYSLVLNGIALLAATRLPNEFAGAFAGGCVMGELGFMALWATIGPNRFWVRWPIAFAMVVIGFNEGLLLIATGVNEQWLRALFQVNLMIPLIFLSAQAPLWLGRIVIGWRVRRPAVNSSGNERRFGILEIMLVMFYFGFAMALCRFVTQVGGNSESLAMSLVLAVYSSMFMLMFATPLLMGILLPTHTRGTLAVLISYFSLMVLLPLVAVWFLAGAGSVIAAGVWLSLLAGVSATFVAFCVILKANGYQLEIRMGQTSNIIESPFDENGESPFADSEA